MNLSVTPNEAWEPLPEAAWKDETIRHLLRRAGWSALPEDVAKSREGGLSATLERLFPDEPRRFEKPASIAQLERELPGRVEHIRTAKTPEERRAKQRELRERSRQAVQDLTIRWLQFAADRDTASFAKWVLFLGDVYVVSDEKVQNAALIYAHETIMEAHALGSAPALTKAVSRSPAMIDYLDLNGSRKEAPNENFARELFELFTLGQGNYTERDIQEAARAFTGYRQRLGDVRMVARQHDGGTKTVFGQSGPFDGDAVIDLVYAQPAAATFLPQEMVRFYLCTDPLPETYLRPLAAWWRESGYDLRLLVHRFFGSRMFFEPSFRGNYIKSPLQFYLGLMQDLQLDVRPLPRQVLGGLRRMGQLPFHAPNVRGWVGGRQWINSATLAGRRQLVEALFTPLDETHLNADDHAALDAARAAGRDHFTVAPDWPDDRIGRDGNGVVDSLLERFLPGTVSDGVRRALQGFAGRQEEGPDHRWIRDAAVAILQSPAYQLC